MQLSDFKSHKFKLISFTSNILKILDEFDGAEEYYCIDVIAILVLEDILNIEGAALAYSPLTNNNEETAVVFSDGDKLFKYNFSTYNIDLLRSSTEEGKVILYNHEIGKIESLIDEMSVLLNFKLSSNILISFVNDDSDYTAEQYYLDKMLDTTVIMSGRYRIKFSDDKIDIISKYKFIAGAFGDGTCDAFKLVNLSCNINLNNVDFSRVTNFSRLFSYSKFSGIIMDKVDTSNVTSMMRTFSNCENLITLKHNMDTSKVTNMSMMFYNCRSLDYLDISCFDTSNVVKMESMFSGTNLIELNIGKKGTSLLEDVSYMFYD